MSGPFLVGLGVAGAAYAAKFGLKAVNTIAENPNAKKTLHAAAAGFRAVGEQFSPANLAKHMPFNRGPATHGFESTMTKKEAALILGVRERSSKQEIKAAHRKIMLLNHPDRGGSPYIASKINAASEIMYGGGRSQSGSAFS